MLIITLVEYTLVTHCRACYSVNINTTRITSEAFQKFQTDNNTRHFSLNT